MRTKLNNQKFVGLSLGGTKTDKSSLAILEYFPDQQKIFLSEIFEKIKSNIDENSDDQIHRLITERSNELELIGVDTPMTLPKCMRCRLSCPGYKVCSEPEIIWMREFYSARNQGRRPERGLSPYTERCSELFISRSLDEPFEVQQPLGANRAPVFARARFIQRRLDRRFVEVPTFVSVWRLGRFMKMNKADLRRYSKAFEGEGVRKIFLEKMVERDLVFIYRQDQKVLIQNLSAFDAFITGLTVLLGSCFKCLQKRPSNFPRGEAWPFVLREDLSRWF